MAGLFRGVLREIDGATENTFEGYLAANRNFAQAMPGRTEDTVPAFQRLTPQTVLFALVMWTRSLSKRKAPMRADAQRPIRISFTMFCQACLRGPDRRLGNAGSGTSYP